MADLIGGELTEQAAIDQGGAGTTVIVAAPADPPAGSYSKKSIVIVTLLVVSITANGTIKFTDSGGDLTGAMPVAANGGFVTVGDGTKAILFTKVAGSALSLVSTLGAVKGWFHYITKPAP